jgi:Bacterial dnaA protein helix-turn-helix
VSVQYCELQLEAAKARKARMVRMGIVKGFPASTRVLAPVQAAPDPDPNPIVGLPYKTPMGAKRKLLEAWILRGLESKESKSLPIIGRVSRVRYIQKICAEAYGITQAELIGKRHRMLIATPRFTAVYLVYELSKLSLPQIGQLFGDRDHTTILNALRKTKARIASEPDYAAVVAGLRAKAEAL